MIGDNYKDHPQKLDDLPELTDGMIKLTRASWHYMLNEVTDEKKFGLLLFKQIFTLAPEALDMFKFKDDWDKGESEQVNTHVIAVVETITEAISKLEDTSSLVASLRKLGKSHAARGIQPAHYDIVGQALMKTIE